MVHLLVQDLCVKCENLTHQDYIFLIRALEDITINKKNNITEFSLCSFLCDS